MVGLSPQKAKSLEESLKRLMKLISPRIVEKIVKEIPGIVISGVSIKLISFSMSCSITSICLKKNSI